MILTPESFADAAQEIFKRGTATASPLDKAALFQAAALCEIAAHIGEISVSLGKLETLDGLLSCAQELAVAADD